MKKINVLCMFIVLFLCCCSSAPKEQRMDEITFAANELHTGTVLYNRGCYERAIKYFKRAHEIYAAFDRIDKVALCLNDIGNVLRATGDKEKAVLYFEEAGFFYQEGKDARGRIHALSNKAAVLIDLGRLDDAKKTLSSIQALVKNHSRPFAPILYNKGILLAIEGRLKEAEAVAQKALDTVNPLNYAESASANFAMGDIQFRLNNLKRAAYFFKQSLYYDKKSGFHQGIAQDLERIGETFFLLGKKRESIGFFKRSASIDGILGDRKKVDRIMKRLGPALKNSGSDITLFRALVEQWLSGDSAQRICE